MPRTHAQREAAREVEREEEERRHSRLSERRERKQWEAAVREAVLVFLWAATDFTAELLGS